jgi:hypothetical protein
MLRFNENEMATVFNQPVITQLSPTAPYKKHLYESFEGATIPEGWVTISNGNANEEWALTASRSHNGMQSIFLNYCSANETMDEWLITPAVDLSDAPAAMLEFYEDESYWANYGNYHAVKISTTSQTDLSTFESVLEMRPSSHVINTFAGNPFEIDLSNYLGNPTVYIAFHYTGTDADRWYIDDVSVLEPDAHDVKAMSLNLDRHYEPGEFLQPVGKVRNVGLNAESFDVHFGYYQWDGSMKVLDTKSVNDLAPGNSADVTFKYIAFPGNVQYTYFVQTIAPSDMDVSNDIFVVDVNTFTSKKGRILIEKATGTWCGYCPGSAVCVDHLTTNYPDDIAVLEYHGGDSYENEMSRSRIGYYRITGYPTAIFNGINGVVGGSSASNWFPLYNMYHDLYLAGIEENTGFSIELDVMYHGNGALTATTNTKYEGVSLLKSYRLFYALSESHIAKSWQGLDSLQHVARAMYPDQNGKTLYEEDAPPAKGLVISDTTDVQIPPNVVQENCHLIAFVQEMASGEIATVTKIKLEKPVTSVAGSDELLQPASFALMQNYPNPFNPDTRIEFEMPEAGNVKVAIYNVSGQLVRTLLSEAREAGRHRIRWDGLDDNANDVVSGIYYVRAAHLSNIQTIKIVKLK